MKMQQIRKGRVSEFLGLAWDVLLGETNTPAGRSRATHSLKNDRDIPISGSQRDQVFLLLIFHHLGYFLQQIVMKYGLELTEMVSV